MTVELIIWWNVLYRDLPREVCVSGYIKSMKRGQKVFFK